MIKENIMNYSQDGAMNSCFNMLSVLQSTEIEKEKVQKKLKFNRLQNFGAQIQKLPVAARCPFSEKNCESKRPQWEGELGPGSL